MQGAKPLSSSQPKPKSLQPSSGERGSSPRTAEFHWVADKLAWLWLWAELKINFQLPIPKVITLWHFMPCKSSREMQLAPKTDIDSMQWLQK